MPTVLHLAEPIRQGLFRLKVTTCANLFRKMERMPPRIGSQVTTIFRPHYLKRWREKSGLSLDKVVAIAADRIDGLSKASLSRIENFKQPYSEPILEFLAPVYDCEREDLLMRDPYDAGWKVVENLRRLDASDLEMIARLDIDELVQLASIAATFKKAP